MTPTGQPPTAPPRPSLDPNVAANGEALPLAPGPDDKRARVYTVRIDNATAGDTFVVPVGGFVVGVLEGDAGAVRVVSMDRSPMDPDAAELP